jgi:hypothetical protein
MIKFIYDDGGSTGFRERRYVVGSRKLNDAVTVFLSTGVNSRERFNREWSGTIFRGICPMAPKQNTSTLLADTNTRIYLATV